MYKQSINQQAGLQLDINTLDNPVCGTTEDTNARWLNAATGRGSVPLADWVTVTTTAADGSSFKIRAPGVFLVIVSIATQGIITPAIHGAITVDAPLATRQSTPTIGTAGVVASGWSGGNANEDAVNINCVYPVRITGAMAASPTLGIIRFGLGVANGTPGPGAFTRPQCWASITKIAELPDAALT